MKTLMKTTLTVTVLLFGASVLSACSPEVGSPEWCEDMKEKPKGDWTANEAAEYAKNCVF